MRTPTTSSAMAMIQTMATKNPIEQRRVRIVGFSPKLENMRTRIAAATPAMAVAINNHISCSVPSSPKASVISAGIYTAGRDRPTEQHGDTPQRSKYALCRHQPFVILEFMQLLHDLFLCDQRSPLLHSLLFKINQSGVPGSSINRGRLFHRSISCVWCHHHGQGDRKSHHRRSGEQGNDLAQETFIPEMVKSREECMPRPVQGVFNSLSFRRRCEPV